MYTAVSGHASMGKSRNPDMIKLDLQVCHATFRPKRWNWRICSRRAATSAPKLLEAEVRESCRRKCRRVIRSSAIRPPGAPPTPPRARPR